MRCHFQEAILSRLPSQALRSSYRNNLIMFNGLQLRKYVNNVFFFVFNKTAAVSKQIIKRHAVQNEQ